MLLATHCCDDRGDAVRSYEISSSFASCEPVRSSHGVAEAVEPVRALRGKKSRALELEPSSGV